MGVDGLWKTSVSPSQFCCKSKPSLKKLNDKKNKFNHHDIFREHFFLVLSISSPIHLKKFRELDYKRKNVYKNQMFTEDQSYMNLLAMK